jgi:hypothetical protein
LLLVCDLDETLLSERNAHPEVIALDFKYIDRSSKITSAFWRQGIVEFLRSVCENGFFVVIYSNAGSRRVKSAAYALSRLVGFEIPAISTAEVSQAGEKSISKMIDCMQIPFLQKFSSQEFEDHVIGIDDSLESYKDPRDHKRVIRVVRASNENRLLGFLHLEQLTVLFHKLSWIVKNVADVQVGQVVELTKALYERHSRDNLDDQEDFQEWLQSHKEDNVFEENY